MLRLPLSRRRFAALALVGGLAAAALAAGLAPAGPARAIDPVFSEDGIAIRGYDPVAYFTEGRPIEGRAEFTHRYQDTVWHFASAANRDAFAAEPGRYAPQYGGYCAWAVSQGYTASIDPDAWHVQDGKLYLNYSRSVQQRWAKDIAGNVSKADANWPGIKAAN